MITRNAVYLSWMWPLGFLGFLEPVLFALFALGPAGTLLSLWASKREGLKVEPFGCCCCGMRLVESEKNG